MCAQDVRGNTPLHWAVLFNALEALFVLIKMGAVADCKNNNHETPLHKSGSATCSRLLLICGARIDARDDRQRTPLHHAPGYSNGPIAYPAWC